MSLRSRKMLYMYTSRNLQDVNLEREEKETRMNTKLRSINSRDSQFAYGYYRAHKERSFQLRGNTFNAEERLCRAKKPWSETTSQRRYYQRKTITKEY